MFSGFRALAAQSQAQLPERPQTPDQQTRRSLDLFSTPTHLAESALFTLKKSLTAAHSPPQMQGMAQVGLKTGARPHVLSLEERLRASFVVGEPSGGTTPERELPASPLNAPTPPANPLNISLPASPVASPRMLPAEPDDGSDVPDIKLASDEHPDSTSDALAAASAEPHLDALGAESRDGTLVIESHHGPAGEALVDPPAVEPPVSPEALRLVEQAAHVAEPVSPTILTAGEQPPPVLEQVAPPPPPVATKAPDVNVEELQERLRLVEQRFADVSTSFKRLQAEKLAADQVLKEMTPLETVSDTEGLKEHFRNLSMKAELSTEEIKRLNGQHRQQELRIEELRDTHRLEGSSQSELIGKLRAQVTEKDGQIAAAHSATAKATSDAATHEAALAQLRADLEKAKTVAKEEEEKRSKAITLLKTVRTKLVKAEKDKEDKEKDIQLERQERERFALDVKRVEAEVERVRSDREKDVRTLREQFEREVSNVKERFEREAAARRGQFELEAITTNATHTKEISTRAAKISALEASVRSLVDEKASLFDQLQMRQGELESSQLHVETLQGQAGEFHFQLRGATDRVALLTEELAEAQRGARGDVGGASAEEVARVLSKAEGRYEARIGDLRERMRTLERERTEAEEEWSRNLAERSREVERLRRVVSEKDLEYEEGGRRRREREQRVAELEQRNAELQQSLALSSVEAARLKAETERMAEGEAGLRQEQLEYQARIDALGEQLEELRGRETQLRTHNKTLREELRKVQHSAALLERQRNPGVGYWRANGSGNGGPAPPSPRAFESSADLISPPTSPRPSSPAISTRNDEEDINLEYLRNVILQFLEHKEMRPNLVRVLSTILRFTPQETRRLIAKV